MSTPAKGDEEKPNPGNLFAGFGSAAGGPLLFGSTTPGNFTFSASTFGSARKEDDDDDADGDDGGDDGGAAATDESHATTDFKPVVNLAPVEVKSGEDDEDILFKSRAKLYVFVKEDVYGGEVRKDWWRERGLGEVKILKNRNTNECRLLMRQEKTLKLCANHKIAPTTELKPTAGSGDKSWTFSAVDFADGEAKTELFALRFGAVDSAENFKQGFETAKENNQRVLQGKKSTPPSSPAKPAKSAEVKSPAKPIAAAPVASAPKVSSPLVAPKSVSAVESVAKDVSKMSMGAEPVRVGGYGKCSPDDPQAKAAAQFACEKIGLGNLVKIASVKSQVVAGMNYKMALHIKHGNGEVHAHVVTVYQPLPHTKEPLKLQEHVQTGRVA